jgi:hypothetical protein
VWNVDADWKPLVELSGVFSLAGEFVSLGSCFDNILAGLAVNLDGAARKV